MSGMDPRDRERAPRAAVAIPGGWMYKGAAVFKTAAGMWQVRLPSGNHAATKRKLRQAFDFVDSLPEENPDD